MLAVASLATLSAAALIPASTTFAAETSLAPRSATGPVTLSPAAPTAGQMSALSMILAARLAGRIHTATLAGDDTTRTASLDEADLDDETLCMAKVVHHEAGNQSHEGKLAVAETILNRVQSGRFAPSICGVVHQPNQYFDTTRYHPRRDSAGWAAAVAAAIEARRDTTTDVVPGALFFRAAYAPVSGFFRNRVRVASVGAHIFYR